MTQILDGKIVRDTIKTKLKQFVLAKEASLIPCLAIIQVGNNPSSSVYIQQKINFGKEIGVEVLLYRFDENDRGENVSEQQLSLLIEKLNQNSMVGGIIIQLPLPSHLDSQKLINLITPQKDVDGLSTSNQQKIQDNDSSAIFPATARGVMSLLEYYDISVTHKKVLVVGRSNLVGKPIAKILEQKQAHILKANSKTTPEELITLCHSSEIIIVATGVPKLISSEHILPHHIIIDVGITRTEQGLVGDVDFDSAKHIVKAISRVPGGVGPLTVASLFQNLLRAD